MNSKMTTNSTTEPKKKQKQTKQTTRTETESEKWRSHGGLGISGEGERGEEWGKVQGIRSINGRHKMDRGRLKIVWKMRSQRTYMYNPWT